MLSDFSWDMTGYIPKHAVNPHGDGIIPYAAERIFQLEPEPPAVGSLNEYPTAPVFLRRTYPALHNLSIHLLSTFYWFPFSFISKFIVF